MRQLSGDFEGNSHPLLLSASLDVSEIVNPNLAVDTMPTTFLRS
jgi:hypothetical protein